MDTMDEDETEQWIGNLPKELHEIILVNLPIVDLINAKLVCPEWLNIICEHPGCQQRLFQQSIPDTEAPATTTYAELSVQPVWVNPLLQNVFDICYSSEDYNSTVRLIPEGGRRSKIRPPPLLSSDPLWHSRKKESCTLKQETIFEDVLGKSARSNKAPDYLAWRPLLALSDRFYEHAPSTSDASSTGDFTEWMAFDTTENWATMLATQPPLYLLRLRCEHMGRGIDVEARFDCGITLVDIAEAAAELCQDTEGYYMVEVDVYQPIDNSADDNVLDSIDGSGFRRREPVDVHRRWETTIRCQLGRYSGSQDW